MGQRCAILLKKNYKDKSTITLIHHQWGIGKVLPALFLQEVLRSEYQLDRGLSRTWGYEGKEPIDDLYTFKPLNDEGNNYITDMEVSKDEDVFSIPVIQKYFRQTDNNNGGLIVEVTQKYDEDGRVRTYGDMLDVKYAFILGSEECGTYSSLYREYFIYETIFGRLVSAKEFALRTFGGDREEILKATKKFITSFYGITKLFGVKEVYNKKLEKEAEARRTAIDTELALLKQHHVDTGELLPLPKSIKGNVIKNASI